MIFTHFKALVSHPLVGMNVLASMEITCIYRASQADGFSLKFFSLLHNVWYLICFSSRCFLVAASILSRASIMPLHSIDSNKFIPTKGCDTNTLKTREYHLHLIKIPSHFCAKTSITEETHTSCHNLMTMVKINSIVIMIGYMGF